MAIFQLEADPAAAPPPTGTVVTRGTRVQGYAVSENEIADGAGGPSAREATPSTFSLAHDVRLLPVELTQADWLVRRLHEADLPASWNARAALRLRFRKKEGAPWSDVPLDPLVLFVPKGDGLGYEILQQVFARQIGLVVRTVQGSASCNVLESRGQPARKFGY